MMIAKANTIQCISTPTMRSQINTDSPNDAPRDKAMVPTITSDATNARVMITMTRKIRVTAANAAIMRSYFAPDWMSL